MPKIAHFVFVQKSIKATTKKTIYLTASSLLITIQMQFQAAQNAQLFSHELNHNNF